MTFAKEFLQETVSEGDLVDDKITSHTRWSIYHKAVFKHDERFYSTTFSVGATEYQDERPYQYEGDDIECKEVFKKEKLVTVYE